MPDILFTPALRYDIEILRLFHIGYRLRRHYYAVTSSYVVVTPPCHAAHCYAIRHAAMPRIP